MDVIDAVPIKLDAVELLHTLKGEVRKMADEINLLFEESRPKVEPKAVFSVLRVTGVKNNQVVVENGHTIRSLVMGDLVRPGQDIVPHVITVGPKLENMAREETNLLRAWLLEKMADYALEKTREYIRSIVAKRLGDVISVFSPGSGTGELFGLDQQWILFRILDPERNVGVHLTSSCMMVPRKSVSGIIAATEEEYVACEYCPRDCESRARPFKGGYRPLSSDDQ